MGQFVAMCARAGIFKRGANNPIRGIIISTSDGIEEDKHFIDCYNRHYNINENDVVVESPDEGCFNVEFVKD